MKSPHRTQLAILIVCAFTNAYTGAYHPDCPPTVSPAPTETAAPSPSPSEAPTDSPAPSATHSPTIDVSPAPTEKIPTDSPTDSPAPSPSPSEAPTEAPTESPAPSPSPSEAPTQTNPPSQNPSYIPSQQPSSVPTSSTDIPSSIPTDEPSITPTLSTHPSKLPSVAPSSSHHPSRSPSFGPSASSTPSESPSESPSDSAYPSGSQSLMPSASLTPTGAPSIRPSQSIWPSHKPSATPSKSALPSAIPSLGPSTSAYPSRDPSVGPTASAQPSVTPSKFPSNSSFPTGNPSVTPTVSITPTDTPSVLPSTSSRPSSEPSRFMHPTIIPSMRPSGDPSSRPSVSTPPTGVPSVRPSKSSPPSENHSLAPSKSVTPSEISSTPTSVGPYVSSAPTIGSSTSPNPSSKLVTTILKSAYPSGSPSWISNPSIPPTGSPSVHPSSESELGGISAPTINTIASLAPSASVLNSSYVAPSASPSHDTSLNGDLSSAPSGGTQSSDSPVSQPIPSSGPSENQDVTASRIPSDIPSLLPSQTVHPDTDQPTWIPSSGPSENQDVSASTIPSDMPSLLPSRTVHLDTDRPTRTYPSEAPSAIGSEFQPANKSELPTMHPSSSSTSGSPSEFKLASNSPSSLPVTSPSSSPVDVGSYQSEQPSTDTTSLPSLRPTPSTDTHAGSISGSPTVFSATIVSNSPSSSNPIQPENGVLSELPSTEPTLDFTPRPSSRHGASGAPSTSPTMNLSLSPTIAPTNSPQSTPPSKEEPSALPSLLQPITALPSPAPENGALPVVPSAAPVYNPSVSPIMLYPEDTSSAPSASQDTDAQFSPSQLPTKIPPSASPSPTFLQTNSIRPSNVAPAGSMTPGSSVSASPSEVAALKPTVSMNPNLSTPPMEPPSESPTGGASSSMPSSSLIPTASETTVHSSTPSSVTLSPSSTPTQVPIPSYAPTLKVPNESTSLPSESITLFGPSSMPSYHPPPSTSPGPTGSASPTLSKVPTYSAMPSSFPSKSILPSSSPSNVPSLDPTAGLRRHAADLTLSFDNVEGSMSDEDRAIFETVAVRLLIDLFPDVEGMSIDFLFVDVVDQEFIPSRRLRQLETNVGAGVLTVDILVEADIWPGELPDTFNFQWVVETFFDVNFSELLARLEAASNHFQPNLAQDAGGPNRLSGQGEGGDTFFTLPIIAGFASATVATIAVGTFIVRRSAQREEVETDEQVHFGLSYSSSYPSSSEEDGEESFYSGIKPRQAHVADESYYSGIKPRRIDTDTLSPAQSGHYYNDTEQNSLVSFFQHAHFRTTCGMEAEQTSIKATCLADNLTSEASQTTSGLHRRSTKPGAGRDDGLPDLSYSESEDSLLCDLKDLKKMEDSIRRSKSSNSSSQKTNEKKPISSKILKRLVQREVAEHGADVAVVSMEAILRSTSSLPSEQSTNSRRILTEERAYSTIVPVDPTPRQDLETQLRFEDQSLPSIDEEDEEEYDDDDDCEVALPLGTRTKSDDLPRTTGSRLSRWFTKRSSDDQDSGREPSGLKNINTRQSYDVSCPGAIESPRDDTSEHEEEDDDDCSREQLFDRETEKKGVLASAISFFRKRDGDRHESLGHEESSDHYGHEPSHRPRRTSRKSYRVDGAGQIVKNNTLEMHTPVWYSEETDQVFGFVDIGPNIEVESSVAVSDVETPLSAHPPRGKLVNFFTIKGNQKTLVPPEKLSKNRNVATKPLPSNKATTPRKPMMEIGVEENEHAVILGSINEDQGGMELEWGSSI